MEKVGEGKVNGSTMECSDLNVISCPCQTFAGISNVLETIQSREQVIAMVEWLSGTQDSIALKRNQNLCCGDQSRCRRRYETSIKILNEIRKACQRYCLDSLDTLTEQSHWNSNPQKQGNTAFGAKPTSERQQDHLQQQQQQQQQQTYASVASAQKTRKQELKGKKHGPQDDQKNVSGKRPKRRNRYQNKNNNSSSTSTYPTKEQPPFHQNRADTHRPLQQQQQQQQQMTKANRQQVSTAPITTNPILNKSNDKTAHPENKAPNHRNEKVTDSKNQGPTAIVPASEESLRQLVDIYVSLIANHMVPSTALELDLLLRLLTVESGRNYSSTANFQGDPGNTSIHFAPIFYTPGRCRDFATQALQQLYPTLKNLGLPLLKGLVCCEPIQEALPQLVTDLQSELAQRIGHVIEYSTDSVTGSHAILTLPFQENRDARHLYRTQGEIELFQNREAVRDSFFYQLREFANVRQKVLRSHESSRAKEYIQVQSMGVLKNVLGGNMIWFAQFFCELLLQVGLAPMSATNEESVNVSGKDTFQQGFSSKGSQKFNYKNNSTKMASKHSSENLPFGEVEKVFPGYQEFFFRFIHAAASYSFAMHLRFRLSDLIRRLSNGDSDMNIEKRLMKLQLLAKFLAYLLFSPNWHSERIDISNIYPPESASAFHQMDSLGLKLDTILKAAWMHGHVSVVIPWIAEFLKMSKWDSLSQSSKRYQEIISCLRFIQENLSNMVSPDKRMMFGPTMQIMSFYLETFFYETLGFEEISSLPNASIHSTWQAERDNSTVDEASLGFSNVILFASNPHVQNLAKLITALSVRKSATSPAKPKPITAAEHCPVGVGNNYFNFGDEASPSGNFNHSIPQVEMKLSDAFFHQHRELKEVCEFAVSRILKKVSAQLCSVCIKSLFEGKGITTQSKDHVLEDIMSEGLDKSRSFLHSCLNESLPKSLELLGPSDTNAKVVDIATSLAISRGMETGEPIIRALVATESKKLWEQARSPKKQSTVSKSVNSEPSPIGLAMEDCVEVVIEAIRRLEIASTDKIWETDREQLVQSIETLETALEEWDKLSEAKIPSNETLRVLFEGIIQIDQKAPALMQWFLGRERSEFQLLVPMYLRLWTRLAYFTKQGPRHLIEFLSQSDIMLRLITYGLSIEEEPEAMDRLVSILFGLNGSNLWTVSDLRDTLSAGIKKFDLNDGRVHDLIHLMNNTPQGSAMFSALL